MQLILSKYLKNHLKHQCWYIFDKEQERSQSIKLIEEQSNQQKRIRHQKKSRRKWRKEKSWKINIRCNLYASRHQRVFEKFSLTLFDTSDTAYLPRQNQCLCDSQNGSSSFYYLSRPFSNSLLVDREYGNAKWVLATAFLEADCVMRIRSNPAAVMVGVDG